MLASQLGLKVKVQSFCSVLKVRVKVKRTIMLGYLQIDVVLNFTEPASFVCWFCVHASWPCLPAVWHLVKAQITAWRHRSIEVCRRQSGQRVQQRTLLDGKVTSHTIKTQPNPIIFCWGQEVIVSRALGQHQPRQRRMERGRWETNALPSWRKIEPIPFKQWKHFHFSFLRGLTQRTEETKGCRFHGHTNGAGAQIDFSSLREWKSRVTFHVPRHFWCHENKGKNTDPFSNHHPLLKMSRDTEKRNVSFECCLHRRPQPEEEGELGRKVLFLEPPSGNVCYSQQWITPKTL